MMYKIRRPIEIVCTALIFCFGNQMAAWADEPRTITYHGEQNTKNSAEASYKQNGSHKDSPYFKHPDFYNMTSGKTLAIIPKFKTYQQTTEWSCGPSAALMVLYHFNIKSWGELEIGRKMRAVTGEGLSDGGGTSTEQIVRFFKDLGWKVESSLTEGKLTEGKTFDKVESFKDWVIINLRNSTPIMVEFVDWGGHWLDIIGYDTMGTDTAADDVIVFADPYDTSDHLQDGYYIYPAERFYYMWFDAFILPKNQSIQQWVIAKPE